MMAESVASWVLNENQGKNIKNKSSVSSLSTKKKVFASKTVGIVSAEMCRSTIFHVLVLLQAPTRFLCSFNSVKTFFL